MVNYTETHTLIITDVLNDVAFDKSMRQQQHPCGIVLGRSFDRDDYMGREFYRVRFGDTTYERVHPVEMEIINEV